MEIKVYISLPCTERNHERWDKIMLRLRGLINDTRVLISPLGDPLCRGPYPLWEELIFLAGWIPKFAEVNFVVFGNGWETDNRTRIEHAVAVLYNIPHCEVDEIETFFRNYIADTFKLDENPGEV